MARRVLVQSVKSGADAESRRVLAGMATTNADPTLATQGALYQGGRGFWVSFVVGGSAGPTFNVALWCYDHVAQRWLPTEVTWRAADSNAVAATLRQWVHFEGGPVRLYLRVESVAGTNPTLDAWISEVVDEP